jgi:hypothetical protein
MPPVSDVAAVDPRQLELLSPREEFLRVAKAQLEALEKAGEIEEADILRAARDLGCEWLPSRPGGRAS